MKIVALLGRMWRFLCGLLGPSLPKMGPPNIKTPTEPWPAKPEACESDRKSSTKSSIQTLYFTDIEVLLGDMREYTQRTGYPIALWDDMLESEMGYIACPDVETGEHEPGRAWRIRTQDLAKSLNEMESRAVVPGDAVGSPLKARLLREYMKSRAGRERIAQAVPGQRPRRVWWETR